MTAPAIPDALENQVYKLVLDGKHYRWISSWLKREHDVTASPSAVQTCVRRAKAEKDATLLDLCDGDIAGGVAVLDSIYRESRVFALRAAEKGNITGGMRALEHQLRVVRVHCEQVRRAAAAEKTTPTAPTHNPDSTLTGSAEASGFRGLRGSCQGVASTPTTVADPPPIEEPDASPAAVPPPNRSPEELAIALELAAQLDRVITDQQAKQAERRDREAADPQVLELRRRWAGDHCRPPRL